MWVPQEAGDRWVVFASELCRATALVDAGRRCSILAPAASLLPSPFGFSGSDGVQGRLTTLSTILRFLFSGLQNCSAMGPPLCGGYTEHGEQVMCRFHHKRPGERALGSFSGRCTWCNETRMQEQCEAGPRQRKLLGSALARQPLRPIAIVSITTVVSAICARCYLVR